MRPTPIRARIRPVTVSIERRKTMKNEPTVRVNCYSGDTYAQRPVSFTIAEREYQVREVLKTWREPGLVLFQVTTDEGLTFTLEYQETEDVWRLASGG